MDDTIGVWTASVADAALFRIFLGDLYAGDDGVDDPIALSCGKTPFPPSSWARHS